MSTKSASTTLTAAQAPAAIGSVTAALLAQVPTQLAEQLRDAIADDLLYVFRVGSDAGQKIVWDAMDNHGLIPAHAQPAKRHLTLVAGGAL